MLCLDRIQIGDVGISALASACAGRALAQLTELRLGYNQFGDAGVSALANACASGALAKLEVLNLMNNRIGDAGVTVLANGAPAQCSELYLQNNNVELHVSRGATRTLTRPTPNLPPKVQTKRVLGTDHPKKAKIKIGM